MCLRVLKASLACFGFFGVGVLAGTCLQGFRVQVIEVEGLGDLIS